jgi:NTE family protein
VTLTTPAITAPPRPRPRKRRREKTVALALGAGGARGLSHILVLEAFDELGIKPAAIAGASIGAIVGAAYAAGMPPREMRFYVQRLFRDRSTVLQAVLRSRVGRFIDLVGRIGNPMLVDGERLLAQILPPGLPATFEQLQIPLAVMATWFHARAEAVFRSGPLLPAIAASSAIPGLMRPVVIDGSAYIDGGAVDPLPVHALEGLADVIVGVDVTGGPLPGDKLVPDPFEAMLGAIQLLQGAVVRARLTMCPADLVIRPVVDEFRVLDFRKAAAIFRAADPVKDETKRELERLLG